MWPFQLIPERQTYVYKHGRRDIVEIRLTTEGLWCTSVRPRDTRSEKIIVRLSLPVTRR